MALEHKVECRTILIKGSVDEYVRCMEGVHRLVSPEAYKKNLTMSEKTGEMNLIQ